MICQFELLGLNSCLQEEPPASTSEIADITDTGKEISGILLEVKTKHDQAQVKQDKIDKDKVAKNLICMSLEDLVLRKVMKEKTALVVWKALEREYKTKSLPNRICLKHKFSCFKFEEHKTIEENLDMFLKLVADWPV